MSDVTRAASGGPLSSTILPSGSNRYSDGPKPSAPYRTPGSPTRAPRACRCALSASPSKRFDPQTQVIQIAAGARRTAVRPIDLRANLKQIDQRSPRAQLDQSKIALLLLEAAAEYVAIKVRHGFEIVDPNDDMVDLANVDLHAKRLLAGSLHRFAEAVRYGQSQCRRKAGAGRLETATAEDAAGYVKQRPDAVLTVGQIKNTGRIGKFRAKKSPLYGSGLNPYQEETWRRQVLIYTGGWCDAITF